MRDPENDARGVSLHTYSYAGITRIRFKGLPVVTDISGRSHPLGSRPEV